jgi:DNA-binding IscR family transcriptional regulator
VVARLKARGLIAEVRGDLNGYVPGRAASSIRLEEVLAAFRSTDVEIAQGRTSPALEKLVQELEESRRRRIGSLTISDLMPALAESGIPVETPPRDASARMAIVKERPEE